MYIVQPEATVRGNIQYNTLIISSVNGMIFLNISHIEIYWPSCYLLRKGKMACRPRLRPPVGFVPDFILSFLTVLCMQVSTSPWE